MNLFDKLDNMLGFNFFNHGRKFTTVQKAAELKAEHKAIINVDNIKILIWLQKQIEVETGLSLTTVFDKVTNEFHPLDLHTIHDLSLTDDLGMDSLELTDLLIEAEEHFNMEILDESAVKVRTVGDALNLISSTLLECKICEYKEDQEG